MKRVTIIVPAGQGNLSTVACIIGSIEIFAAANARWKSIGKQELCQVELAGVSKATGFRNGLVSVRPQVRVSDIVKTDLIIVPASDVRTYQRAVPGNRQIIDWIGRQYKLGAEVASTCSGAFMLAASGVLDGRTCSTHWKHTDEFRKLFPEIHLKQSKLITDERGVYTNGGAYSFLNLIIYLVEKYFDRPTAIYCAKIFQVDIDRQSQSSFAIFSTQKNHDDELVKKAQAYIEDNLGERLTIEELSNRFAIGRRHFDRRFIKATGNTPIEYAQRVRIESAKKAFETTRKNVNEVMFDVGYSDVKAFRDVFRKITGLSPLEYRKKYNKDAEIFA